MKPGTPSSMTERATSASGADDTQQSIQLRISGMTCTSCAARIERKLGKLPDTSAIVNYANDTAYIKAPVGTDPHTLIQTVHDAGYEATPAGGPASGSSPDASPGDSTTTAGDAHSAHDDTAELAQDRRRLIIAWALVIPVMAIAMVPGLQFDWWQYVIGALATVIWAWCGWPFHRAAVTNARHGAVTMDTLISAGSTIAYVWSLVALAFGSAGDPSMRMHFSLMAAHGDPLGEIYFEAASGIIAFLLAGRYLEHRAKRSSSQALREMLDLSAREATVVRRKHEVTVPIDAVSVGDVCRVRPGEKIPTDGVITEGVASVDTSMVTGESLPVDVGPGAEVIGGTLVTSGSLLVETTAVGSDTTLATITELLHQAQLGKAPVQRLVDRISRVFVPTIFAISALTFVGQLIAGQGLTHALSAAVAVIVVACPCALGLATPTALMVGTATGARHGLLIKGPQTLESTKTIDTLVLDKTGTLTTGQMRVADAPSDEILQWAGAVEKHSEHPIGRAIVAACEAQELEIPTATDFQSEVGQGVAATVAGHRVSITRPPADTGDHGTAATDGAADVDGATHVLVTVDNEPAGMITLTDTVRETSAQALAEFDRMGLTTYLFTGDNAASAASLAKQVGIDPQRVSAGLRPEDKLQRLTALQQEQGAHVAMVGDGINDAAALAQADLGIAMGSGTDVAIEASDMTIINSDPLAIVDAIRLAKATLRTIYGNLFWALAYNVVLVPVAASGLLNPMLSGLAMALSSLCVVGNSLRLRYFRSVSQT